MLHIDIQNYLVKEAIDYRDQVFTDDEGEYSVGDISDYAVAKGKRQRLLISTLLNNLEQSPEDLPEDIPGSPEFISRAENADLKHPLLAVKYNDGTWLADGVHRLWKAKDIGRKTVLAQVINNSELKEI